MFCYKSINLYEVFSRPQTTQLQDMLFQLLKFCLKASKFPAGFKWCGREFRFLGRKLLRFLVQ